MVALGAACSGAPLTEQEAVGSSSQAITGTTILSRADQWVTAKLLYCQSPNGVADPDPSCSAVCTRESNPAWDPYRSDCSGFVSWAWGLPAPGRTTSEFAPADTTVSFAIKGTDLQPGDALNIPSDHMILFVSWVTMGSEANFYEEPGCSSSEPYAHSFTSKVTITGSSVDVAYEGKTFTAIRYTGLTGAGEAGADTGVASVPCTVTTTGDMGDCLSTAVCASMGGTSTPGYCPGAADIQCCTGVPAPPPPPPPPADGGKKATPDAGTTTTADTGTAAPPDDAGTTAHDGATGTGPTLDGGGGVSDGGGGGVSGDAANGETPAWHHAGSGCSTAPSRGGPDDGPWLFGLGAVGLAATRRRRRRPA